MDTFERLKNALVDYMMCKPDAVTLEAAFKDELGFDSLDNVEVMMLIEEEFDIHLDDEAAAKLNKVGEAVKHIDSALADQALSAAE